MIYYVQQLVPNFVYLLFSVVQVACSEFLELFHQSYLLCLETTLFQAVQGNQNSNVAVQ